MLQPKPEVQECAICLEELGHEKLTQFGRVNEETCGHTFHNQCAKKLALKNSLCPVCRSFFDEVRTEIDTGAATKNIKKESVPRAIVCFLFEEEVPLDSCNACCINNSQLERTRCTRCYRCYHIQCAQQCHLIDNLDLSFVCRACETPPVHQFGYHGYIRVLPRLIPLPNENQFHVHEIPPFVLPRFVRLPRPLPDVDMEPFELTRDNFYAFVENVFHINVPGLRVELGRVQPDNNPLPREAVPPRAIREAVPPPPRRAIGRRVPGNEAPNQAIVDAPMVAQERPQARRGVRAPKGPNRIKRVQPVRKARNDKVSLNRVNTRSMKRRDAAKREKSAGKNNIPRRTIRQA